MTLFITVLLSLRKCFGRDLCLVGAATSKSYIQTFDVSTGYIDMSWVNGIHDV